MLRLSRRDLLAFGAAYLGAVAPPAGATSLEDEVGAPLAPWRAGRLDIHHIATGRGDATLIVAPDGATMLVDAGAANGEARFLAAARPDESRRPGEWIARYAQRRLAETGGRRLDYALITHLHPDHLGDVNERTPLSPSGDYRLTGISDVDAIIGIDRLIDPDYPEYGYPRFETPAACENYIAYVRARAARGGKVERLEVGRRDQIRLGDQLEVRNLAARGRVWTGEGDGVRDVFPPRATLGEDDQPNENASSAAIRLSYGAFDYFCGGDLTDWADAGARLWMDALTPAARAAGHVEAAMVPHHGLFDASGAGMAQALAARVWIISAWHVSHPSLSTLDRLFNPRLYPGPRDIYATSLAEAADLVAARLTAQLASREGHVILRVDPQGNNFRVIVTDSRDEADRVTHVSDTIACA